MRLRSICKDERERLAALRLHGGHMGAPVGGLVGPGPGGRVIRAVVRLRQPLGLYL